jgi:hypothetical protein
MDCPSYSSTLLAAIEGAGRAWAGVVDIKHVTTDD